MTTLTEKVLKGIDDTRPVHMHADRSAALKAFLNSYDEQTKLDGTLPVLTPSTSGRELKDAFNMLELEIQLKMLSSYWNTVHGRNTESEAVRDERRQRHWMIKAGTIFAGSLALVVVGAMMAIANKNGELPDSAILNGLLKTAGEILKVIIGAGNSK